MRQRLLVLAMVCAGLLQVGAVPAQEAAASRDSVASPPGAIAEIEIVAPDDATLALLGELDIEVAKGSEAMTFVMDEGQLAALDAAGVEFSVLRRGLKLKGSLAALSSGPGTSVGDADIAEHSASGAMADCAWADGFNDEDVQLAEPGSITSNILIATAPDDAVVSQHPPCPPPVAVGVEFGGGFGGPLAEHLEIVLVHEGISDTLVAHGSLGSGVVTELESVQGQGFTGTRVNGVWRLSVIYTGAGALARLDRWEISIWYELICTDPYEPNETFGSAIPVSPGVIESFICDENDVDYFKFTAAAGQEIHVYLDIPPVNYDIGLISPSGQLLETSTGTGTYNEHILRTAAVTGD